MSIFKIKLPRISAPILIFSIHSMFYTKVLHKKRKKTYFFYDYELRVTRNKLQYDKMQMQMNENCRAKFNLVWYSRSISLLCKDTQHFHLSLYKSPKILPPFFSLNHHSLYYSYTNNQKIFITQTSSNFNYLQSPSHQKKTCRSRPQNIVQYSKICEKTPLTSIFIYRVQHHQSFTLQPHPQHANLQEYNKNQQFCSSSQRTTTLHQDSETSKKKKEKICRKMNWRWEWA